MSQRTIESATSPESKKPPTTRVNDNSVFEHFCRGCSQWKTPIPHFKGAKGLDTTCIVCRSHKQNTSEATEVADEKELNSPNGDRDLIAARAQIQSRVVPITSSLASNRTLMTKGPVLDTSHLCDICKPLARLQNRTTLRRRERGAIQDSREIIDCSSFCAFCRLMRISAPGDWW